MNTSVMNTSVMNVATLNEIGITLCMAFGLAVFYFVGRKNARRKAVKGMEERNDAGPPNGSPKEPDKGKL